MPSPSNGWMTLGDESFSNGRMILETKCNASFTCILSFIFVHPMTMLVGNSGICFPNAVRDYLIGEDGHLGFRINIFFRGKCVWSIYLKIWSATLLSSIAFMELFFSDLDPLSWYSKFCKVRKFTDEIVKPLR